MEFSVNPAFVAKAKAKENRNSDYNLCIKNGICPKCGSDMKVHYWDESAFTDMICSICNITYNL